MKRFFQIFLISIVMILALSGLLICIVIAFVKDDPPVETLLIWGVFSAIIFATCLTAIIRFNTLWIREAIAKFHTEPESILAQWEVPMAQWRAFTEFENREKQGNANIAGWVFGAVLGFILLLCLFKVIGILAASIGALAVGGASGFLLHWALQERNRREYRRRLEVENAHIAIRRDSMLINRRKLISLNQLGTTLKDFRVENPEGLGFPLLAFEVSQSTGENDVVHTYRVPAPEDRPELIETVKFALNQESTQ